MFVVVRALGEQAGRRAGRLEVKSVKFHLYDGNNKIAVCVGRRESQAKPSRVSRVELSGARPSLQEMITTSPANHRTNDQVCSN